ncbi:DUF1376 domain-containing protein [Stenotrophomonas hibiscicola]|uniref:DUF1376 domain-containing protein n=1 Tax=Stenotrophomonas hibiscicola TaxID=86189 RepID=UPI00038177BD|nr:DUF1376 domain-containing protein [[Pseudomonas] hibiscicola]
MNYFELHLGDYAAATAHLSLIEDAIYSRLLRRYYLQEEALPADVKQVARLAGARSQEELEAVQAVLDEFFTLTDTGWHNKRADEEIARYKSRVEAARENGKKGGNPKKKAGYNEPGYLYAVQRQRGGSIKVGITKYPAPRMSDLRSKNGPIDILAMVQVSDMGASEAAVHRKFASVLDGEWISAPADDVVAECLGCSQASGTEQAQMFGASSQTLHTPDTNLQEEEQKQQHVQPLAARCRFADFWAAYPNKKGKQEAEKTWKRRKLDSRCDELIGHVRLMEAHDDGWRRGYVPMGSTYLNQARWEDVPQESARAGPQTGQSGQQLGKTAQGLMALKEFANGGVDQTGNFGGPDAAHVFGPGADAGSGGYPADRRRLAGGHH